MTDVISDFCGRHSIDAGAFRAEAKNGWAPAAGYLLKSGVDPANLSREELHEITEAVHDLRFGVEPVAGAPAPVDAPEPKSSEAPMEDDALVRADPTSAFPRDSSEKLRDAWARAIADLPPVDIRRA